MNSFQPWYRIGFVTIEVRLAGGCSLLEQKAEVHPFMFRQGTAAISGRTATRTGDLQHDYMAYRRMYDSVAQSSEKAWVEAHQQGLKLQQLQVIPYSDFITEALQVSFAPAVDMFHTKAELYIRAFSYYEGSVNDDLKETPYMGKTKAVETGHRAAFAALTVQTLPQVPVLVLQGDGQELFFHG